MTRDSWFWVLLAATGCIGCGEASNDAPPELSAPAWDSGSPTKALRAAPEMPALRSPGALAMTIDTKPTPLVNAILYAEGNALRFAASAGKALACDALEPAWGVHYVSVAVDEGPKGNYYIGDSTSVALIARIPYDTQSARDVHPSTARVQIGSPQQAAEWAERGTPPSELAVTVDARRTLVQPANTPMSAFAATGTVTAAVCPSAAELLAKASHVRLDPPTEWVHAEIGDRRIDVKSVLAFSADDTKNGASIAALTFYELEGARCDDAVRPLHDNGGGINGLQVDVGPLAIIASRPQGGFTQSVLFDVTDVTAGRGAFAQVYLTRPSVAGHVHVGDVDYKINGDRLEAGSLHGWIRGAYDASTHARVEGMFVAKICKR